MKTEWFLLRIRLKVQIVALLVVVADPHIKLLEVRLLRHIENGRPVVIFRTIYANTFI